MPEELVMIDGLETLDLSKNRINVLQPTVQLMSFLRSLDLSENLLKRLPEELGNLSPPTDLDLSRKQEPVWNRLTSATTPMKPSTRPSSSLLACCISF
jgi:Leucine-rich repeat (LRR) protein